MPSTAAQAQYGDEGVRQLKQRQAQEKQLAEEKLDVNMIPLGAKVWVGLLARV
jgi:hypothetical protein